MRLKDAIQKENFRIMALDDEQGIIDSLGVYLNKYDFVGYTDPIQAIEALKTEHFDLLILDFLMMPIHGDQVVEEIRKFNSSLYILLSVVPHNVIKIEYQRCRKYCFLFHTKNSFLFLFYHSFNVL